jgi:histidinol-phosphate aminotransferase
VYADIGRNASDFKNEMAANHVIIRGAYDGYENYSRVSMGRLEELEVFDSVFSRVFTAG